MSNETYKAGDTVAKYLDGAGLVTHESSTVLKVKYRRVK